MTEGKHVMIVDDSEHMRELVSDILENDGYEVVGMVDSCSEAVRRYLELQPDMVTLNLMSLDGEAVDAVRRIVTADRDTRILVIGALYQKALVLEAPEAGARDFIVRPFEAVELTEIMGKVATSKAAFDLSAPPTPGSVYPAG